MPALIKDRINYQVMGSNSWKHVSSLEKAHDSFLTLYMGNRKPGNHYQLENTKPRTPAYLIQEIDLTDRTTMNNNYYPYPIIIDSPDLAHGLSFISEPFEDAVSIDGIFEGQLKVMINKQDMDIGVVLYEVMPDGRYFHLSYFLGRASYSKNMSKRKLLKPGTIETIPFERTRMVSRQLHKGSCLLVVVNVNKNPFAQINYGTGKDVSDESGRDATTPLVVRWYNTSFIKIPVCKSSPNSLHTYQPKMHVYCPKQHTY